MRRLDDKGQLFRQPRLGEAVPAVLVAVARTRRVAGNRELLPVHNNFSPFLARIHRYVYFARPLLERYIH